MGIVRRQSTYSTIFTYLGFAIGALNTMILFPRFFTTEAFGLTRIMIDFSLFFSALSTMGSLNALYKFNPFYKDFLPKGKNDLPYLTLMANLIGSVLFLIAAICFEPFWEKHFGQGSPLFVAHFKLVIPFTISYTAIMVLEAYCWIIKKTIVSNIVKELFYRLTTTLFIFFYIMHWISLETFFVLFSYSYIPAILVLIYVIYQNGGVTLYRKISRATKRLYKKILVFTSYHYTGMLIGVLPRTVDGLLIAGLTDRGLENLAIYSIPVYLASIMDGPYRSMLGITTTLIAEAWKNKDMAKIKELYHKTSINLLIIGLLIFGVLLLNIDNLIRFNPEYSLAKAIFIVAGLAKIIDLGMGMNAQILLLSKYWRMDFYSSLIFIVVNIILDYFMIRHFGVMGAAYGSAIALIFYNMIRFSYLWWLFKLQPFDHKTLYVLLIAASAIGITWLIPFIGNLYLDAIMRAAVFGLLYVPAVVYCKISEDINSMFRGIWQKILPKSR